MPSKSPKQARFMAAAAHDPEFAKSHGISQSVAKDFNKADAGTGILKKESAVDEDESYQPHDWLGVPNYDPSVVEEEPDMTLDKDECDETPDVKKILDSMFEMTSAGDIATYSQPLPLRPKDEKDDLLLKTTKPGETFESSRPRRSLAWRASFRESADDEHLFACAECGEYKKTVEGLGGVCRECSNRTESVEGILDKLVEGTDWTVLALTNRLNRLRSEAALFETNVDELLRGIKSKGSRVVLPEGFLQQIDSAWASLFKLLNGLHEIRVVDPAGEPEQRL